MSDLQITRDDAVFVHFALETFLTSKSFDAEEISRNLNLLEEAHQVMGRVVGITPVDPSSEATSRPGPTTGAPPQGA